MSEQEMHISRRCVPLVRIELIRLHSGINKTNTWLLVSDVSFVDHDVTIMACGQFSYKINNEWLYASEQWNLSKGAGAFHVEVAASNGKKEGWTTLRRGQSK